MIASFGTKQFQVSEQQVRTFDGLSYETKISTEKKENAGKKPSTNIKGAELDTIRFSLPLSVDCGLSPMQEMNDWKKLLTEAVPYLFLLGTKQLGDNKFLLISLSMSEAVIAADGGLLSCVLELSFEEFVAVGSSGKTGSTGKSTAPGIQKPVSNHYGVSQYTKQEKAQEKRQIGTGGLAAMSMAKRSGL